MIGFLYITITGNPCGLSAAQPKGGALTSDAAYAALPFAGLGISLAPVIARAEGMVLVRVRVRAPRSWLLDVDVHHRSAGYGLLVELSREIRGR